MLRFFNSNKKNSINKLELILNSRKSNQQNQSIIVKRITSNVKKNGDKAVLMYEKKFSNVKSKSNNIRFSKKEINGILKKINKDLKQSIDLAFNRIKNASILIKDFHLLNTRINLRTNYLIHPRQ